MSDNRRHNFPDISLTKVYLLFPIYFLTVKGRIRVARQEIDSMLYYSYQGWDKKYRYGSLPSPGPKLRAAMIAPTSVALKSLSIILTLLIFSDWSHQLVGMMFWNHCWWHPQTVTWWEQLCWNFLSGVDLLLCQVFIFCLVCFCLQQRPNLTLLYFDQWRKNCCWHNCLSIKGQT